MKFLDFQINAGFINHSLLQFFFIDRPGYVGKKLLYAPRYQFSDSKNNAFDMYYLHFNYKIEIIL